jgi:2-polyprenyl-3-methyl-5-hydroxy-6-metoxy-1,4-benzoquinol methylase
LIFVPDEDAVSVDMEKERYRFHNNTAENKEYVAYLKEFTRELTRMPISNPEVLDFGSGQERVLTQVLQQSGYDCYAYDPLYEIGMEHLNKKFDIIIFCEVVEHLRDLRKEMNLIKKILHPQGYVIIRMEICQGRDAFIDWWYTKDKTHINFFSMYTMKKLADLIGKSIFYTDGKNVIILG